MKTHNLCVQYSSSARPHYIRRKKKVGPETKLYFRVTIARETCLVHAITYYNPLPLVLLHLHVHAHACQ